MSASILPAGVLPCLALSIPLSFGAAALLVSRSVPFRAAARSSALCGVLAVAVALGLLIAQGAAPSSQASDPIATALAHAVRLDAVAALMLLLVCAIAVVIVRYSRTYLRGDPCQGRYERALLAMLGTVTLFVVSDNLLVIALAWIGTSLALHQLLTTYRERPQALVAAHKKFLLSRLADVCVLGAVGLLWHGTGSLSIDALVDWARAHPDLSPSSRTAAVLLALGVALKSAQLPFHGWLIQVMEAPTPVSALLHAGIVNLGGFVLIRLAPFLAHADGARLLLVLIGTATAVLASLIMTTRVSVKVGLAWSTCAQIGMMLLQCGLGLWHLALLHLLAHSLYKAHAFLGSGRVVAGWRAQANGGGTGPLSPTRTLAGVAIVLAGVGATCLSVLAAARVLGRPDPSLVPVAILLALSLSSLAIEAGRGGLRVLIGVAAMSLGVSALYLAWHAVFSGLGALPMDAGPSGVGLGVAVGAFSALFVVQLVLQLRPAGRLARALQPSLFAGLYLDELFTRMTFRLWPPGPSPRTATVALPTLSRSLEASS
ncbi:MAG: NADH-quinone oxidoreductase subunit L [Planctomycetota bacterium]